MKYKLLALLCCFGIAPQSISFFSSNILIAPVLAQSQPKSNLQPMNIERLETILRDNIDNVEGQSGQWQLSINNTPVIVIADASANRMRIISPVTDAKDLTPEEIQKILVANFHTTLDARYAVTNDFLVATFIHPLNSLQEKDLLSALNQVVSLVKTYGSTYSSGELLFIPGGSQPVSPSEENLSI